MTRRGGRDWQTPSQRKATEVEAHCSATFLLSSSKLSLPLATLSDELQTIALEHRRARPAGRFHRLLPPDSDHRRSSRNSSKRSDVLAAMSASTGILAKELEVLALRNKIQTEVQDQVQQSPAGLLPARAVQGDPKRAGREAMTRSATSKNCAKNSKPPACPSREKRSPARS